VEEPVHDGAQTQAPRRENWFDPDFVREWIERQEAKTPEARQLTRVRDAIPQGQETTFRYLNLGAGAGTLDALLLAHFPHAEATLVDGSSVMAAEARQRLASFGARARVVEANLSESNWIDTIEGPFDGAVSTIALHNLRDPMRIRVLYAEVSGLVSDGGWFLNLDYTRATGPTMGRWFQWATSGSIATGRPAGRGFPGTLGEQLIWLSEAGFSPVDCIWREAQLALMAGCKGAPRLLAAS
jgi:tRNA (cmo5U34)-methyltransferase